MSSVTKNVHTLFDCVSLLLCFRAIARHFLVEIDSRIRYLLCEAYS